MARTASRERSDLREGPQPQPEEREPPLADPGPADLSKRDYAAILKRSISEAKDDHITNYAAALAYYAFLAIPSALLIAVGVFGLVAEPAGRDDAGRQARHGHPGPGADALHSSLERMTQRQSTGVTLIGIGGLLALWSMGGAMQNLMWALNASYDREETRGFLKRRLTAFMMVFFALIAFALLFGVLVLGPHLSSWIGSAVGEGNS